MTQSATAHLRFDGQVAVVTGAGRGLGREHALLLAKRGAKVLVNDIGTVNPVVQAGSEPVAQQVVDEITKAGGIAVANTDSVVTDAEKIIQAALGAFGQVDILVCNAGIAQIPAGFGEIPRTTMREMLNVHVEGTWNVCQAVWPHMIGRKYGRIVLTSSPAGMFGLPFVAAYNTGKAAVLGLNASLAVEGWEHGIRVNSVAPVAGTRMTQGMLDEAIHHPKFVAAMIAPLCHKGCRTTGSIFELGSGWYARTCFLRSRGLALERSEDLPELLRDKWEELVQLREGAELPGPGTGIPDTLQQMRKTRGTPTPPPSKL